MSDLSQAVWFKSSYSGQQGECVEVAFLPGGKVGMRDSKNLSGPALIFTRGEWDAFLSGTVDGEFNQP